MNGEERTINVFDEITDKVAHEVVLKLLELDSQTHEPIILQLFSGGGSVIGGLLVIDVMRSIESPVYTVGLGACSSIASLILAAGEHGYRKVSENIYMVLHQPSGSIQGGVQDMSSAFNLMNKQKEQMIKLYSVFTSKDEAEIRKDLEHDFVLYTAQEVIDYGLADSTI